MPQRTPEQFRKLGASAVLAGPLLPVLASGLSNTKIAQRLYLSHATVKTHINRIFAKIDARDRALAVRYARQHGLTNPGR